MNPFEDREPVETQVNDDAPVNELVREVISLADAVVDARMVDGELARRRELMKRRVHRDLSTQATSCTSKPPVGDPAAAPTHPDSGAAPRSPLWRVNAGSFTAWPTTDASAEPSPSSTGRTPHARSERLEGMALRAAAETVVAARQKADQILAEARRQSETMMLEARRAKTAITEHIGDRGAGSPRASQGRSWHRGPRGGEGRRPRSGDVAVRRRSAALLLLAVMFLGLVGTGLAATALRHSNEVQAARALTQQSQIVAQAVSAEMRRYYGALTDMAAAVGAQNELEASDFTAITAAADRARLPGASSVAFVVAANTGQVPQVQAQWRSRGATGLVLRPAKQFDSHLFVVLSRSLDGGVRDKFSEDLTAASPITEALELSRTTHGVATSSPYRLLRDTGLPLEYQQLSVMLAAPVFASYAPSRDQGRFRGWVVLGVGLADFLRQSMSAVANDAVAVTLRDATSDGEQGVLASWQPRPATVGNSRAELVTIGAARRTWQLEVVATDRLVPQSGLGLEVTAWVTGSIITLLLALITRQRASLHGQVLRRAEWASDGLSDDIAGAEGDAASSSHPSLAEQPR